MTRDELLAKMLEKGKVTQAWVDKVKAKDAAKGKIIADMAKMTKAELVEAVNTLLS